MKSFVIVVIALLLTGSSISPTLALDPVSKCVAFKMKTAGKYSACRLGEDSRAVRRGALPDYTKCDVKFAESMTKSEVKSGPGVCPTEGDQESLGYRITDDTSCVAKLLSGESAAECVPAAPCDPGPRSLSYGSDGDSTFLPIPPQATLVSVLWSAGVPTTTPYGVDGYLKLRTNGGTPEVVDHDNGSYNTTNGGQYPVLLRLVPGNTYELQTQLIRASGTDAPYGSTMAFEVLEGCKDE